MYGFYQIGQGNKHRRFVLDEKHNARAILVPFLQSEEDRRYAREAREMRKMREVREMRKVREMREIREMRDRRERREMRR